MNESILIVEDEGIVSMQIQDCVMHLGYDIAATVDTGEAAVEIAQKLKPDLVLMDIRLKGSMDGIEAAAHIREQQRIPVIYLTAYCSEEKLERAQYTEPYGYLLKPVQEESLETAIRMAMYKHRQEEKRLANLSAMSRMLESLSDGIIVTDTDLSIKYMNKRASELTGSRAADASGQDIREMFDIQHGGEIESSPDDIRTGNDSGGEIDEVAERALSGETIIYNDCLISTTIGVKIRSNIRISPFTGKEESSAKETLLGLIVTMRELTAEGEKTTDISSPLEQLPEEALSGTQATPVIAEERREELISRMSELRSFIEIEIIKSSIDRSSGKSASWYYRRGRENAYRTVFELLFGTEAMKELESNMG